MSTTTQSRSPWGIDVSNHQGTINWDLVKTEGVQFAFIKATEGGSFRDGTFKRNWREAKRVGILRGAYHFFRPRSSLTAQQDNFADFLGDAEPGDLPPVIDVEVPSEWSHLTFRQRNDMILNWIEGIRKRLGSNVHPIIYMSSSFAGDVLGHDSRLAAHPLWVAHYTRAARPTVPKPWQFETFWQYTDRGRIDGVSGNVDLNWFNGSRERLEALLIKSPGASGSDSADSGTDTSDTCSCPSR